MWYVCILYNLLCSDIMHASYYGAYIDDYTIFQTSVYFQFT